MKDKTNAVKNLKLTLIYNPFDNETKEVLNKILGKNDFITNPDISIDGFYTHSYECPFVKYKKAYDAQVKHRVAPKYDETLLTDNQKELLEKTIAGFKSSAIIEGFVLEIPDCLVFAKQSDQTYFISPDNNILSDMLDESGPELSVNELPEVINPGENFLVLSSCWGGNFYHWLTWTVPRLWMVQEAGYKLEDFDRILINYVGFKFQKELVELLNIPKSKIIATLPNGAVFKAKRTVTASLPEFVHTPDVVVKSLRHFFLKPEYIDENMPKRLYLSRNKSTSRYVTNEDELQEFLASYGFTTIYAEELTFSQQVKYFSNAEVVLSQHGAGLTNLAFCKTNSKVVEIYNERMKKYLDTAYWRISSDVGLEHYFMFGEPQSSGPDANMYVDLKKLETTFKLAEI